MKKILVILITVAVANSCTKDSGDSTITPLDITMKNVAGSYKVTAATLAATGTSVDVFYNDNFFKACNRDDIYKFADTGSYTITDAGMTCNPSTSFSGSYAINAASKKIAIDNDSFIVVTLNATKMELQQSNFRNTGLTGNVTFTRQ